MGIGLDIGENIFYLIDIAGDVADPKGFEPSTSAFGGQNPTIAAV
jgi:hypothetical protein